MLVEEGPLVVTVQSPAMKLDLRQEVKDTQKSDNWYYPHVVLLGGQQETNLCLQKNQPRH